VASLLPLGPPLLSPTRPGRTERPSTGVPMRSADSLYLDHAATTPVAPSVLACMLECLSAEGTWANPASRHGPGRAARARVETARQQVAALVGAEPAAVIWTSGATESINLALLGVMRFASARGRGAHLVTVATEHSATLSACRQLEREGVAVSVLGVDRGGRVDPEAVLAALRPETVMVSLMMVNNETGVRLPIEWLAARLGESPVVLHVDAAQAAAFEPIDVGWGIDLLSLSAHKFYGPKGVGALVVRRQPRLRLQPLLFGGGAAQAERPGTLPVHQLVGMGEAARLALRRRARDRRRLAALRSRLVDGLAGIGGIRVNGAEPTAAQLVNISVIGVHGEALAGRLGWLAYSAGSACHAAQGGPSPVLRAMGVADGLALASLRLGLGRGTRWRVLRAVLDQLAVAIAAERTRCVLWAAWCDGVDTDALYRWQAADLLAWWSAAAPADAGLAWFAGAAGSVDQGTLIGCRIGIDRHGTIAGLDWQCYGDSDVQHSIAWLPARLTGHRVDDVDPGSGRDWCLALDLPSARLGSLLVIEDALQAALGRARRDGLPLT
jgi:cysteine desulfurase